MKVKLISADAETVLNDLPAMIGRNHTADVCLDDAGMGEFQCIIEQDDGRPSVADIAGGLGTFVNGRRIRRAASMPGDRLGVGRRNFTVRYELRSMEPARATRHDNKIAPVGRWFGGRISGVGGLLHSAFKPPVVGLCRSSHVRANRRP